MWREVGSEAGQEVGEGHWVLLERVRGLGQQGGGPRTCTAGAVWGEHCPGCTGREQGGWGEVRYVAEQGVGGVNS